MNNMTMKSKEEANKEYLFMDHIQGCEARSYSSLGVCHRLLKRFDKSLGFHTQVPHHHPYYGLNPSWSYHHHNHNHLCCHPYHSE